MTKTTPQIEAPISLRGAPQFIRRHAGKDADDIIDKMIEAAEGFSSAAQKIAEGANTILADKMQTPERNMQRARNFIWRCWEPASKRGDQVRAHVESVIQRLDAETMPRSPAPALAAEIRQRLAAMTPKDRKTTLAEHMHDQDVIGAAIHASSFLTGLSAAEREKILHDWRMSHHAPTMQRIARLKAALADLDRLHGIFLTWWSKLDSSWRDAVVEAEASEAAAKKVLEDADCLICAMVPSTSR